MNATCPASAAHTSPRAVDRLGTIPSPVFLYTVQYDVQMGKRLDPPPSLSRERILDVALAVIDRDGLGALSMRRLAQELDVWPMALYHYFRDKDELLDGIAARTAGSVPVPSEGESWREQLVALLHGARAAMARDPAGMGGSLARAFLTPEALRVSEAALTILLEAGLSKREAASAWRALWSYTYGFATFQLAPTPEEALRRARVAIAGLPDQDYPTLLSCALEASSALADEDEFEPGLSRLLDGIWTNVQGRDRVLKRQ
jgi:AcrR family transcriptional regulator